MGKNKLKKFADMQQFSCVYQYPWAVLQKEGFPMRGSWREDCFGSDTPIVLELGCGKGEYTVGLAGLNPDTNYVGIDIKGARMWTGASAAESRKLGNVAFLRTDIELLDRFFAPGEVDEIWITFPDPQMQKTRKRLTSARFLNLYSKVLKPGGRIHLKTDSPFLYAFTSRLVAANALPLEADTPDLYAAEPADAEGITATARSFQTHYERQWLSRGKTIKFISFSLPGGMAVTDPPEDDIERDDYVSYSRDANSRL